MSVVGRIIKSGERYALTPYNDYIDFAENYLSHHNKAVLPRHAPSFYSKEKIQAIGNQLHKAKKRINSNVGTGKPSGVNERPAQASEAVGKAPEASATQAVEKAPELEPEAPGTSTGTTEAAPTGEREVSTEVKDSGVQTLKTSPRRTETGQPTSNPEDVTQTTGTGTQITEEKQTVQPGGEAPKSGGKYDPTKFMEMAEDKNLGRSERQMLERLGNMRKNAQRVFDKGTDEQIKKELGHWGIEAEDGATTSDYMNKIDEMLKEKAESGPTIGDKFRAHHGVGLTGLGVVGVSTLDLANSRGQQSNAQLYSDPFA